MEKIFETERLYVRRLIPQDAPFIIQLLNSPGWLRFIGDRQVKDETQALAYLQNGPFKSYQERGYGLLLVLRSSDNQPIGMCGLLKRPALSMPDIGFAFLPEYMGLGYAHEAAEATLAHAHKEWKVPQVAAITLPENEHSVRLLKKLGLQYQSEFSFPDSQEVLHLYAQEV
ncbi:GNAT family N-acetyltransferase [Cytophagales bacterium LB-30]|uniref:GNAT family N-acetyltransferase n=1 Tax=Shiella aurantiaca TaxID=3058365 RepID=A0ABT8F3M6_9BACT|nr:GNAT family N-acetyltransferase [Shiella aurantiaca]MDN4165072.1 GNAT family N-acetyltransferase [Shiella aurantiaca]